MFPEYQFGNKEVHITKQNIKSKVAAPRTNSMDICTYDEADARLVIHILGAAENGIKNIIIRTVDSNILTIVLGQFELIAQKYDNLIGFGKGKDYIVYDINETFINIVTKLATSFPSFHVLTGADNTSAFHRQTKLVTWEPLKSRGKC